MHRNIAASGLPVEKTTISPVVTLLARIVHGTEACVIARPTMPILTIRHVTTYHYRHPVAFGEHRMMLRPRDDDDQKMLECALDITPEPSQLAWTRDCFGNHVATARFASRSSELRFESTIRLDHAPAGFCPPDIEV